MTLIEIIVVISLIAFIYAVVVPEFSFQSGAEVANRLSQLSQDIRFAYDMSVLTGRPHRIVFHPASGTYQLETTWRKNFRLASNASDHDPNGEEEKILHEEFISSFKFYEELVGEGPKDLKTGNPISIPSILLSAKDNLKPTSWVSVDSPEWQNRTLGSYIIIKDMQAEHHLRKQDIENLGEKGVAIIYFFPQGYAERAVIHIYYRKGDMGIDENLKPYTIKVDSLTGTVNLINGIEEIDFSENPLKES